MKTQIYLLAVTLSLLVHGVGFYFLKDLSLTFPNFDKSFFTRLIKPENLKEKTHILQTQDKERLLTSIFQDICLTPYSLNHPETPQLQPQKELSETLLKPLPIDPYLKAPFKAQVDFLPSSSPLTLSHTRPLLPKATSISPGSPVHFLEAYVKSVEEVPIKQNTYVAQAPSTRSPKPEQESVLEAEKFLTKPKTFYAPLPEVSEPKIELTLSLSKAPLKNPTTLLFPTSFSLPDQRKRRTKLALVMNDSHTCWEGDFDVKMPVKPTLDQGEYIFSLNLIPRKEVELARIPQEFFFLIDNSQSVTALKFETFCDAVIKALNYLQKGDLFNIIFFDKELKTLSSTPLTFTTENIQKAKRFLKSAHRSRTSRGREYLKALYSVLTAVKSHEHLDHIPTAVILSDGDLNDSISKQRELIYDFTMENQGRVACYVAEVRSEPSNQGIEYLALNNRGTILQSATHTGFPRKFARLVHLLDYPVLSDVQFTIIPKDPTALITFTPSVSYAPNLYLNQEYLISGKATTLTDFTLFIQGKCNGQRITIKRNISLTSST